MWGWRGDAEEHDKDDKDDEEADPSSSRPNNTQSCVCNNVINGHKSRITTTSASTNNPPYRDKSSHRIKSTR